MIWFAPHALHVPDGFLSTTVSVVGWVLALLMIGFAIRLTRHQLGEKQIPMMGLLAAFIFAAQAINFPVAAGTSGHLLGGALAAIVMGPWAATLIMTSVIVTQGLLFQDGGLLVMGWNILNMGVFTAFTGFAVYVLVRRLVGEGGRSRLVAAFVGAWLSVEVGAIATAFELAASGTSPLSLGLPAMASIHALIGLGEAFITSGAIALLQASRPQILDAGEIAPGRRGASYVLVGLIVALGVAILSPLASQSPDGLEFVAERQEFLDRALEPLYELLPDYSVPFVLDEDLTTILAVVAGTFIVFGVAWAIGRTTARKETIGE
jgi:cobalt/nickel transport system permease protein